MAGCAFLSAPSRVLAALLGLLVGVSPSAEQIRLSSCVDSGKIAAGHYYALCFEQSMFTDPPFL
jgi:hypothetical protein